MKIYVAGAYSDQLTVQSVQQRLRSQGHTITHDWTNRQGTSALEDAECDWRGVKEADLIVLVFSVVDHAYRGTFTELGLALAHGKRIVALRLVDGEYRHNPFLQLPQVKHAYALEDIL
jgi:nucleoside 2-deoxyribosyltransferase